ncbi:MICU2-like protein [Mya arenaria]|uniref:MICU2-like protein n=1 Tax=Mya arenaria TaxID=6604 RepID=A0ABY7DKT1_MYAAR|nr:MICU2-like protein [Mya arenaria]
MADLATLPTKRGFGTHSSRSSGIRGLSRPALTFRERRDSSTGLINEIFTRTGPALTFREVRFQQFASVQYEGVIYMTPQDFLESVTEDVPRHTNNGSSGMMVVYEDKCWNQWSDKYLSGLALGGLISYTEYLFLLCVLTKPQSGFRIAFNMFDTDGNQIVDKKEFLVLESFFTLPPSERKFMENLQTEVIELEFLEFSKGMQTISEEDFARILLRYTNLDKTDIGECLQRGISFDEFRQFSQFMNSLDDFTIAMNMYTYAQQPVSKVSPSADTADLGRIQGLT